VSYEYLLSSLTPVLFSPRFTISLNQKIRFGGPTTLSTRNNAAEGKVCNYDYLQTDELFTEENMLTHLRWNFCQIVQIYTYNTEHFVLITA
jgi:hypothetical protein